ncbi:MAG: NAD(P)H-dependent oxidoreductase [Desulfomonile sp.]|nr:NAD(P)H-dependent oxidoreductase [Desulfomonile sp.]
MNETIDLLVVYHSQSGNTERLAQAVADGGCTVGSVVVRLMRAAETNADHMRLARCLVLCSPEYFGYMAGAVKDLFDRTYEQVREEMVGKSYAVVICAGNDGTGALSSIERIIAGYKLRKVQPPIIIRGDVSSEHIESCRELGRTLAAGIDLGIY